MKHTKCRLMVLSVCTLWLLLGSLAPVSAQVKLAPVFTDHMVVQRDKSLPVWGWCTPGETVTVRFNGQKQKAKADKNGKWMVTLKSMAFGGPFELTVASSEETKTLTDILIGDVWFCSGQSNMEMPIEGWGHVNNFQEEIAQSDHPAIRVFTVEKARSFQPQSELKGDWKVSKPQNAGDFSATAYFFGRKLNQELGIPVGLIISTWGGTNIQTWISWDTIQTHPDYKGQTPDDFARTVKDWAKNNQEYQEALKVDPGVVGKWYESSYSDKDWDSVKLPAGFEQSKVGNVDGIVWFRKTIVLNQDQASAATGISLGVIDDQDLTYINGQLVGTMDNWVTKREYKIPQGLLKAGENTITIKVYDASGSGGMVGPGADLYLETGGSKIDLSGEWRFKPAVTTAMFNFKQDGANAFPSQLYNAMVNPFLPFPITGIIWYQGEENTNYPNGYAELFQMLIRNWRSKWGEELPFIWAQLANFMAPDSVPVESAWATIRADQHQALELPKTAEAVLIDIGDVKDIHPKNKQEVGRRMALAALHTAYGQELVYSGPVYKSLTKEGSQLVLDFDHTGSGLIAKDNKYGYLNGFAIAGKDHQYKWAIACLRGNQVIVFNPEVSDPISVRYGWGNNPDDLNLFNKEGLPASPFSADEL